MKSTGQAALRDPLPKFKIQPSKFVVENELLFPEGCAIKYIMQTS